MIEIKNLMLYGNFNQFRLNIKNLIINEKGIRAIIGHNGAGKSSLLNTIAGLEAPAKGHVTFEGFNTFLDYENIKNDIHLISWNVSLFQNMSIMDHMNLIKGLSKKWNLEFEKELLRDFVIPPHKKVQTLSRGEQTKLKLLLSLPRMPKVVLLDEVTNDLDTDSRRSIFKKLDYYSFETGANIIIATNMVDDIERYATTVTVLKEGEVVLDGNLDSIKEEHKSSFDEIVRSYERVS